MMEPVGVCENIVEKGHRPPLCGVCENHAVVELKGIQLAHGVVYSRGSAPCAYCAQGIRLAGQLEALPSWQRIQNPLGYRWEDVVKTPEEAQEQAALIDAKSREWREKIAAGRKAREAASHAASAERREASDG